jgi:hypothetical protein
MLPADVLPADVLPADVSPANVLSPSADMDRPGG